MEINLRKYIDHTLLKQDATKAEIDALLEEAKAYDFKSVCVNPYWVKACTAELKDSDVLVCTVIGFPLGANHIDIKALEAKQAVADGATEIDMVINIGALKAGNDAYVQKDIEAVVQAVDKRICVKVIIETALLTDAEKILACQIAQIAGADFVKTSTGFSTAGATIEDIQLMRKTVGPDMGVKASGGIRSAEIALQMIGAGATRIGASASMNMVKEYELNNEK